MTVQALGSSANARTFWYCQKETVIVIYNSGRRCCNSEKVLRIITRGNWVIAKFWIIAKGVQITTHAIDGQHSKPMLLFQWRPCFMKIRGNILNRRHTLHFTTKLLPIHKSKLFYTLLGHNPLHIGPGDGYGKTLERIILKKLKI